MQTLLGINKKIIESGIKSQKSREYLIAGQGGSSELEKPSKVRRMTSVAFPRYGMMAPDLGSEEVHSGRI
jgi:hypothetical protein